MSDSPPSALDVSAMETVCRDTLSGWLWYCDEHDSHGNGDSEAEVRACAEAHEERLDPVDPCPISVWRRTEHERTGH